MDRLIKWVFRGILLFGLIWVIIATVVLVNIKSFQSSGIETKATITSINFYGDEDSDVFVRYQVDNREYNQKLNYYSSNMHVGDELIIYYDKTNPGKILGKGLIMMPIIFYAIGVIFILVGLIAIIKRKAKDRKIAWLIKNGRRIYADVDDVVLNTAISVQINGMYRNPYRIICSFRDTATGRTHIFKSENMWVDPFPIIEHKRIKRMAVYVNMKNYKKYYVETSVIK